MRKILTIVTLSIVSSGQAPASIGAYTPPPRNTTMSLNLVPSLIFSLTSTLSGINRARTSMTMVMIAVEI